MTLPDLFTPLRERIDEQLIARLPADSDTLATAMRYGVCNGGKRIRPLLVYAIACGMDLPLSIADPAACAVEFIHAYSLVHDDLPAMDNDDLRRGMPTCHIEFDEATAILVGDALHSLAFECLADTPIAAGNILELVQVLSHAIGYRGMAGGQALDLSATGRLISLEELEEIHRKKTGALLVASAMIGAIVSGCDEETTTQLAVFAKHLGLAFQIQDDLLDVYGKTESLGKNVGSDQALEKPTYATFFSQEEGLGLVSQLFHDARVALQDGNFDPTWLLSLVDYLERRNA